MTEVVALLLNGVELISPEGGRDEHVAPVRTPTGVRREDAVDEGFEQLPRVLGGEVAAGVGVSEPGARPARPSGREPRARRRARKRLRAGIPQDSGPLCGLLAQPAVPRD